MTKLLTIGAAAEFLGVSTSTLRRWERAGRLIPLRTKGGQRRYDPAVLRPGLHHGAAVERRTVAYARVSRHDQINDLARQKQVFQLYCASQGWTFELIDDLGPGMNHRKKGLQRLLDGILEGRVGRLVLTHKDRLLRFGAELVFAICETREVEVVIVNQGQDTGFEEELASDVLEIVTVFSARLYGNRSHESQKLIDGVKAAVQEAQCS